MRHVADACADFAQVSCAEDADFPTRRPVESGECTQEGCLASAIIAEDGEHFTAREFRSHAAQGGEATKLFYKIMNGYDGGGRGVSQRNR